MKLLRAADHRRMPWKNGGGETLEVAVFPPDAGIAGFDWRVSMAVVAEDGRFSAFPGIDRTLVLLDGGGMTLDIAGRGPVLLTPDSAPCVFPGDVGTTATLDDGPITDLNVMTARGRYAHSVERFFDVRDLSVGARETVLLLGTGMIVTTTAGNNILGPRDLALLEGGEAARVRPSTGLVMTIRPIG